MDGWKFFNGGILWHHSLYWYYSLLFQVIKRIVILTQIKTKCILKCVLLKEKTEVGL